MKDCLGREWQLGTIQLDFQLPLNFDLKYRPRWTAKAPGYGPQSDIRLIREIHRYPDRELQGNVPVLDVTDAGRHRAYPRAA